MMLMMMTMVVVVVVILVSVSPWEVDVQEQASKQACVVVSSLPSFKSSQNNQFNNSHVFVFF